MTKKLRQKRFLKGSREFEIIDDTLHVRLKRWLKEEKMTIELSSLDPNPIVNESELAFYSRYRGRPVLSLTIDKPNSKAFTAFVDEMRQAILGEGPDVTGTLAVATESSRLTDPDWNVYEEPPEFAEPGPARAKAPFQPVNATRVEEDIAMLKLYLKEDDIKPLIVSLDALKEAPENEAAFQKFLDAFNDLGIQQGAVLTYAPYLKVLLSQTIDI